jgi:OHCU decarboxylase
MDGIAAPSQAEFIARFGDIFEHSPWVAARAWARRPFADVDALHAALMAALHGASAAEQLALINAHPELGAKIALTDASTAEQTGAGLKNLSPEEYAQFTALNAAYREKFGFPFIICVRLNTKASILAAYAQRLTNNEPAERAETIAQIGLITRLRLEDLLNGAHT